MSRKPSFLEEKPKPTLNNYMFKGTCTPVWDGKVKINSITFWEDSPRLAFSIREMIRKEGKRPTAQDEFVRFMMNSNEVKLKPLAEDIMMNGLQTPLILDFDGKVLDGNRRYFAINWLLRSSSNAKESSPNLFQVNARILTSKASEELGQTIAVWANFFEPNKLEWSEYLLTKVFADAQENGLTVKEISDKFGWPKFKVKEILHTNEIISEFVAFAVMAPDSTCVYGGGLGISKQDAEETVAKNYHFFKEVSFAHDYPIKLNMDFRFQLFRWIYEGKFENTSQLRLAYLIWQNPESKSAIMQSDKNAAKNAKAILEYNIPRIRCAAELRERINNFSSFLEKLKISELEKIPDSSIQQLEKISKTAASMSRSVSKK